MQLRTKNGNPKHIKENLITFAEIRHKNSNSTINGLIKFKYININGIIFDNILRFSKLRTCNYLIICIHLKQFSILFTYYLQYTTIYVTNFVCSSAF